MIKSIKRKYYYGAAATLAVYSAAGASTANATVGGENNFSSIATNISASLADLPGLVAIISYLFGLILGVLGVLKIKDHVENPQQTPLKDGAIRLCAGGVLFALPILFEAMFNTAGDGDQADIQAIVRSGADVTEFVE